MARTLLLVEDAAINREILKEILSSEYDILEACNGREALDIINARFDKLSAVLLDLMMPVMDGYAVLEEMSRSPKLKTLPVIVTSGRTEDEAEAQALDLGASDYITKPYNSTIIKQRLRNIIRLRENTQTVNILQRDSLTGLYSREVFFEKARDMILAKAKDHYIMACFDINKFKVINDQYGTQKGDEVLKYIADVFKDGFSAMGGLVSRIESDSFAVLYPAKYKDSPEIAEIRDKASVIQGIAHNVTFSIGRYLVGDLSLKPSAMYDRAILAAESIRGRFDTHIALYDESMRSHLIFEQQIVTEMVQAKRERQFETWFQPQFNHTTGALKGAEALVRWRHPVNGLIPPAKFIGVFEQNGFIYELDKYVWEDACVFLRDWIDKYGSALPVSVNISRYDLFRSDIIDVISGLIKKYDLSPELLRLEITESAFAESTDEIVGIVNKLIKKGFTIEIDDFGSGYSSLNTLKSVPAQVLKLDMRFFEASGDIDRSGSIVESIVRMTKWLGMSVIAEGVETREQADFLKSVGCNYVQGYLYKKPMTRDEYSELCVSASKEEALISMESVVNLDNSAFWNPSSMDTLIFNSYVGGACIFEYHYKKIELLRVNDKYAKVIGGENCSINYVLSMNWDDHMNDATRKATYEAIKRAIETCDDVTYEAEYNGLPGGESTFLRTTFRLIARTNDRYLLYGVNENITAQRIAEKEALKTAEEIRFIIDNIDSGICVSKYANDGNVSILFSNDRFYSMYGYTKSQFETELSSPIDAIYLPDRKSVIDILNELIRDKRSASYGYHCVKRDGEIIEVYCNSTAASYDNSKDDVVLSVITDVTNLNRAQRELMDNLPYGVALLMLKDGVLSVSHLNKRYWELVARAPKDASGAPFIQSLHPDDKETVLAKFKEAIKNNTDIVCDARIRYSTNQYKGFHIVGRVASSIMGEHAIHTIFTPLSDDAVSYQEMLPIALKTVVNSSSDMVMVKDVHGKYVCCSPSFARALGMSSQEEIIGKTDYDIVPADSARKHAVIDAEIIKTGMARLDYDEVMPTQNGNTKYSKTSKYPLLDSAGNVIGLYAVTRDITEYHSAYERLKLMTDSIDGGLATYLCTKDSVKFTYYNDSLSRRLGYTKDEFAELANKNALFMVEPDDLHIIYSMLEALSGGASKTDKAFRMRAKNGELKWVKLHGTLCERVGETFTVNAVILDISQQVETTERLRLSEQANRLAIEHSRNTVCSYDVKTKRLTLSSNVNQLYNLPPVMEDVPYGEVRSGRISPETADDYIAFYENIGIGKTNGSVHYQRMFRNGWRWLEGHFSTIFSDSGLPVSAVVSFTDVTDRLEKEAVYKKWQQSLLDRSPDSYTLFRCNISKDDKIDSRAGSLLSVEFSNRHRFFNEYTIEYAQKFVFEADREAYIHLLDSNMLLVSYHRGKRSDSMEYREMRPDGGTRWLKLTIELIEYPKSTDIEAYLLYEDITDAKETELQTKEMAQNDPLTGILNRNAFKTMVEAKISESPPESVHALLMLDLDGFKSLNDVFGHVTGDKTLTEVAHTLRASVRRNDLAGRLGGDEFMVFLSDIRNESAAADKARHICSLLKTQHTSEVETSASIGIAIVPRDGVTFDELYKKADAALYYVKGSGKDNFAFYKYYMADEHLTLDDIERSESADGEEPMKRRMLVITADSPNLEYIKSVFGDDYIVENVSDSSNALIRLRHYGLAISIVLLDINNLGENGFITLEGIRGTASLKSIPVIALCTENDAQSPSKAIIAGAADYVSMPFDRHILRTRVAAAITKNDNERLSVKNALLEYQNGEMTRYRTALDHTGTFVIEYNRADGMFTYDSSVNKYLFGNYDRRSLFGIFTEDGIADSQTVAVMRAYFEKALADRRDSGAGIIVKLRTPKDGIRDFKLCVYAGSDTSLGTGTLYLSFTRL